jgi:hypothetical protein
MSKSPRPKISGDFIVEVEMEHTSENYSGPWWEGCKSFNSGLLAKIYRVIATHVPWSGRIAYYL